jgi:hypothetical protein
MGLSGREIYFETISFLKNSVTRDTTKSHEIGTSKESVVCRGEVVGSSNAAYPTHQATLVTRHPWAGAFLRGVGPSYFLTKPSMKVRIINYYVVVVLITDISWFRAIFFFWGIILGFRKPNFILKFIFS